MVLQSGQAAPEQLVKILVSASNLPTLPTGKSTQAVQATGGPLGPVATPSLPKTPPTTTTTTTSRPTPELASKQSDPDPICVAANAAEGVAASKAKPEMVNLLSDEETDKEDVDQGEKQLVRRAGGMAQVCKQLSGRMTSLTFSSWSCSSISVKARKSRLVGRSWTCCSRTSASRWHPTSPAPRQTPCARSDYAPFSPWTQWSSS